MCFQGEKVKRFDTLIEQVVCITIHCPIQKCGGEVEEKLVSESNEHLNLILGHLSPKQPQSQLF